MANAKTMCKGLSLEEINNEQKMLIDPDNVFWGVVGGNDSSNTFISRELISLYEKVKKECDQEMNEFRFSKDLTAVYIDPTDLCNADCPYCYVPRKTRKHGRSMTEKELYFVLDKIAKYLKGNKKKPVIIFHASEPLLVKDILFKAITRFKDRFYFGIQTNALLLERKDVEFIKAHKASIGISLDAADVVTNNRLRFSKTSGGNFEKAVQAIRWFKGYKGLNVITTMTSLNLTKLPALVKFLHKERVSCVLINSIRLTQKNSRRLRPDDKLMAKYFIKAVEEAMRCSKGARHKIIVGTFSNVILAIVAPTARRLMCDISPCGGGRCFFTITASGEMIPCGEFIGLKGFSGGNIFNDSIARAMKSEAFGQITSRVVEGISECNTCVLRNICGAPCPAELHALGGMHKKAVFCEFYKEIIAYAFRLIARGKEKYLLREEGLRNVEYAYRLD